MNLAKLYTIINTRKNQISDKSYVSSLIKSGEDRVIQKVGEEAVEVVIAAKSNDKDRIISEMADLWFHSLILLSSKNITPEEIFTELEKRDKSK